MTKHKTKKGTDKYKRTKFFKSIETLKNLAQKYEWGDEELTMEEIQAQFRNVLLTANLYIWDEYPEYFNEDWDRLKGELASEYPGILQEIAGREWYAENIKDTMTEEEATGWTSLVDYLTNI